MRATPKTWAVGERRNLNFEAMRIDNPTIRVVVGWLGFPHARIGRRLANLERILMGRRLL